MSLISSINPKLSAIWFAGILQVNLEKKKRAVLSLLFLFHRSLSYENRLMPPMCFTHTDTPAFPPQFSWKLLALFHHIACHGLLNFIAHHQLWVVFGNLVFEEVGLRCLSCLLSLSSAAGFHVRSSICA